MRGPLDDALAKLARRDELRRRATGEAPGTPPAVTELVESIAAVIGHHPGLGVTVGVEGAGEPLLLHFYFADGQVQVNAENAPDDPPAAGPRHADYIEVGEVVDEGYAPQSAPPAAQASAPPAGGHRRFSEDDQDRFGPAPSGYASENNRYAEPDTAERRYGSFDEPPAPPQSYFAPDPGEDSRDLGARLRDLGMATSRNPQSPPAPPQPAPHQPAPAPHPFAATPPPEVPPQYTSAPPQRPAAMPPPPRPAVPPQSGHAEPTYAEASHTEPTRAEQMRAEPHYAEPSYAESTYAESTHATRRIHPEQHRAPAEPSAAERIPHQYDPPLSGQPMSGRPMAPPAQPGMPQPLPKPIPLPIERPEETEIAARRLAALLRDDPSLLSRPPD